MNELEIHEMFMQRCIEIAKKNSNNYYPNPSVGALIVKNNKIISEGCTSDYGGNHAEVNAISSVKNKSDLINSTIYVTLEPCSHYGKTPPCSKLIIESGIKKAVIGCVDNSSKVNGKGISMLKNNGVDVISNVLEEDCIKLHRNFLHFNKYKKPYIILKWAKSKDQFIAPFEKKEIKSFNVSSLESRQLVHKWRSEEHAILVGYQTVKDDNPKLTTRHISGRNPLRIVLDKKKSLESSFNVFNNESKTIVIDNYLKDSPFSICKKLFELNVQSLIVEGGKKTLELFINNDCWDEARIFENENLLKSGIKSPSIKGILKTEKKVGKDKLKIFTRN